MSIGVLNTDVGDIDIGDNDLFHKINKESWTATLSDGKDFEIDMDIGDVEVKRGSKSQIRFVNIKSDYVSIKEEKGKQKITIKHPKVWNLQNDGYIEVTLSEKDLNLEIDANMGCVCVEDLSFAKLSIDCDLGDIDLNNVMTSNCEIDQNAGDITMNGTFLNKTEIENDMGDIDITLTGKEEDYNIKIDNDLGDTSVGDEYYSGSSKITQNKKAKHALSVSNHMGDINVQFG